MQEYKGYTYPAFLLRWPFCLIWKKLFCKKNIHLWDECLSDEEHYLVCDICGETVLIDTSRKPYERK